MGHNRNLADYAHHFDGTNIDLGSGNIETEGVVTYEDVTNVDSVGIITARAGVRVPDSQNISLGTGNDFAITHDGTNTTFINDTGQIQIRNRADDQDIILQTDDGSGGVAVYLRCDGSSGQVDLNHYGSRKFYTSSTGATVNGTLVSDGVTSELDLSAISSSISNTAVDVFVYDTRKDSDGGAWRKRTQNTSWYNETLNTSTRGSRKEFPAVAVIVATTANVFIYDGDDPDLPLWMRFNQSTSGLGAMVGYTSFTIGCVTMLNGLLMVGLDATNQGNVDGLRLINFISEQFSWKADSASRNSSQHWPIEDRNGGRNLGYNDENYIVSEVINDVAATVLPNSQIDDATGLPVPTIAVATKAGVSVIKDDGTVVDLTTGDVYDHYSKVEFGANNRLYYTPYDTQVLYSRAIPSADQNYTAYNTQNTNRVMFPTMDHGGFTSGHPVRLLGTNGGTNPLLIVKNKASGSNETSYAPSGFGIRPGLTFIDEGETNPTSMVAYTTTSYNTGWMQGDIKGTFLSDTDTTNATYTTVADDWATAAAWTKQSSISLTSTGSGTSGTVSITGNGTGSNVYFFNAITVEANTDYVVTVTFGAYNANEFYINDNPYTTANKLLNINALSGLTRGGHFNSGSYTTLYIQGYQVSTTATTITNVVVQKVSEKDRSVNNKGLQVSGTVTKSAVATGADLVAYSGFSASNKLENRSDYDFGAGTSVSMCIIGWFKTTNISTYTYIMSVYDSGTDHVAGLAINASSSSSPNPAGTLYLYDSVTNQTSGTTLVNDGQWHCAVGIFDGPNRKIYLDGKLQVSNTYTSYSLDIADTDKLTVGRYAYNDAFHFLGSLALTRISKSIPSPEQVKKMYEDEKVLFQENAKATLYGSSDAVTALGYDEDTELLHVGTSAGRSDFQGLRRINNTTTAVTTAISASDELIAEQ